MPRAEDRAVKPEPSSLSEVGRRSHETITGMVTNLFTTPEFMAALGQGFFGRTGTNEGNRLRYIYFEKGDYGYLVRWRGSPLRYSPKYIREYNADLELGIDKYDPREKDERDNPKKIASLRLKSVFYEDQNGEIKEFTGGYADIEEDYQPNPPYTDLKAAKVSKGTDAFDRIPEVYKDLYPSPVKL